jgi:hypothetical protein
VARFTPTGALDATFDADGLRVDVSPGRSPRANSNATPREIIKGGNHKGDIHIYRKEIIKGTFTFIGREIIKGTFTFIGREIIKGNHKGDIHIYRKL